MAVSSINFSRVSQNLRTMTMLQSLRRNTRELFTQQTRLSSGRSFITPSDDPRAAAQALKLNETAGRQTQILENLRHANLMLGSADNALSEINSLFSEAESIASGSIGAQAGPDERLANASLISSIRERLMAIGNRQVQGQYIFAGRQSQTPPFVSALGGVAYVGDSGDVMTRVSFSEQAAVNVAGDALFGGLATAVVSSAGLNASLSRDTRLEDLAGANLKGIRPGVVVLAGNGGTSVQVDLTEADTVGDVLDMTNAAATSAGLNVTLSVEGSGLSVAGGGVTIRDTATGATASDLGIVRQATGPAPATAIGLAPRITPNTLIENLNGGAGVSLDGGLIIKNGSQSVTVDLTDATTVQDILNKINSSGVFVSAGINSAGTGLEVVSRVAGVSMGIAENGGTTASDLGITTFGATTKLSDLNFGRGVELATGEPDLRIAAKDGGIVEVNLDGAETVNDVVSKINQAATDAGVAVEASFLSDQSGIQIQDATGGTDALSVTRASNASFAVDDLGLLTQVEDPATELVGQNVSLVRADNVFTALIDLETSLRANDDRAITDATQRLQSLSDDVTRLHGVVGARAQAMESRVAQTENAVIATQAALSDVEDLDYTEAVTRFQQAQTALQANLQSGSQLLNLSLLDFLR